MRIALFLLISIPAFGQHLDTTKVFSLDEYLNWVRKFHPIMQQAALLEKSATAELMVAKGNFDPEGFGEYEDKSFDQKNYFRVGEAGLKVPTWWGADVKLSYLWSNGTFLNNSAILPENGQAVLGIEVPLLQGVVIDQRRVQVKQAELLQTGNEAERNSIINNLLLESIEAYWDWANKYQLVQIYNTSLQLAEDRFRIIKESFLQGDKPAIDTLESMIQLQNRQQQLSQAKVELQNATLQLSNYLWYENTTPLEISPSLRPEELSRDIQVDLQDISITDVGQTHPDLQILSIKQEQLVIKEKLKREALKPQLRLNYNFLGTGFNLASGQEGSPVVQNLFTENYKWGVNFSYPLFLRKARGGLQLVRLEQLENNYKMENKSLNIVNKINGILQLLRTTYEQVNRQQSIVRNYSALLEAENIKFEIGESSIFLLNNREQKLIESQMKLLKLQVSLQKLQWKLRWAQGMLK